MRAQIPAFPALYGSRAFMGESRHGGIFNVFGDDVSNQTDDAAKAAGPGALHKKMMSLLSSLWVTQAVGSFARLGLADTMDDGAQDPVAIAAPRGLDPDRVFRLLRALSTVGIVVETAPHRFTLTPLGKLLGAREPRNMRTAAMLLTEYHADVWSHLDEALAGGVAFEAANGRPLFEWLGEHPDEAARFHRMMVDVHGPETQAVVDAYDFTGFDHIVDIGGGNGSVLSAIVAAAPGKRATLFDLPEGIAAARRGQGGPLPNVNLVAGNVFDAVPEGGDAYLLRHLLHDYDDPQARKILGNIRRAMSPEARVIVLEAPLPTDATPAPGRWLDLHVMLLNGGRERTLDEYCKLFEQSGLKLARALPTKHPAIAVIEAVAA
jgi:ubiquinone/menaquinone biosynthesis C-methylase UbiE